MEKKIYFLNLKKRNKAKSHLTKILNSDSVDLSEPETVLSSIKSFCSTLYRKRNDQTETDCFNYMKTLNLLRLTDDESRLCYGELTKRECWEMLQTMGNNKIPGNDCLYVCLSNESHSYLLEAPDMYFRRGQLSSSQRQAVIVLIEEKDEDKRILKIWKPISLINGEDKRILKIWKPISLINVDAKIALKAIASRVKKVIGKLVYCDQTAYVCNRNIGESVRLINDILEYIDENDIKPLNSLQTVRTI